MAAYRSLTRRYADPWPRRPQRTPRRSAELLGVQREAPREAVDRRWEIMAQFLEDHPGMVEGLNPGKALRENGPAS
jgi:hypothetical protein